MVDSHQLLHHFGGDGDLAARDSAEPWQPERAQSLLGCIRLIEVPRRHSLRQILVWSPGAVGLVQETGGL
jgi:hypothetical protein